MNWSDFAVWVPTVISTLASSGPWGIAAMLLGVGGVAYLVNRLIKANNARVDSGDSERASADSGETSTDLRNQVDANRNWIKERIEELVEKEKEKIKKDIQMNRGENMEKKELAPYRNREVLLKAAGELGVQEWKDGSNPRVERYLDHGSSLSNKDSGLSDDISWCAGFIAYCLETIDTLPGGRGMGSTNSLLARSYQKWGVSSKDDPLPGDIVVFWRGKRNGWQGHVAFFIKQTKSYITVCGGNQSDEVNISTYSKSRLLDIRRSSKHKPITQAHRDELHKIAQAMLIDKPIEIGGKVS